jgi:F0F1-type ATP synthase delta subunit
MAVGLSEIESMLAIAKQMMRFLERQLEKNPDQRSLISARIERHDKYMERLENMLAESMSVNILEDCFD